MAGTYAPGMTDSPRFTTLQHWLDWQERLHPSRIDLGLDRVSRVADCLQCRRPAPLVISVAGTNGKGSSVAMLEAILSRAGYRVGCYTSPHLLRYNERLRLCGEEVSDQALCEAFARIDQARGEGSLTYFEFGTLAALDIMSREVLDVALLEVGLGGRLDAVNIVDADAAMITSIGIDHTEWLGADRESIAREKAGIMRAACPVVCGDTDPPHSLRAEADRVGAGLQVLGQDFSIRETARGWHWQGGHSHYRDLPRPALSGAHQLANAAAVLMLLEKLEARLPVTEESVRAGLKWVKLAGRVQRLTGRVEQVLDVSHNAQAALALADALRNMPLAGGTHAVFGMMRDKDAESFARALDPQVSCWYPAGLAVERASSAEQLRARIEPVVGGARINTCQSVADAMELLKHKAESGDRVLVCGSFYTVAEWTALRPGFG
ncbi:MAG: bifunctional tetrahydrofolate synthase/dihydrofolate synthase [Gammaproteobacteria bacterium]|nr:MAG: bifunctional tetrahydrofolate synthase/dihydrofolate synthase [Gammaproteobacteria bacterium]